MKKIIHRANTRGYAELSWLKSYHTFSFASYHNPERVHFGRLRVLNDDWIAAGGGFDTHPHDNMEIVTILLDGALRHKDSMGNEFVIKSGEVQRMSAGTGIRHSEHNASDQQPVNLLQIWILPQERDIEPGYEQKSFSSEARENRFQVIVAPDRRENSLWINQNAFFSLADMSPGEQLNYRWLGDVGAESNSARARGLYLFVISGDVEVAGEKLSSRDAIGLSDIGGVPISALSRAVLLAIEVPMT